MEAETLQSIGTVLAFAAFLGVCWWAYVAHKKSDFEEQSKLPFDDDEPVEEQGLSEQNDADEKNL